MAAVPLPDSSEAPAPPLFLDALQDSLFFEHRIEVPVVPWPHPPKRLLRVSAQLYNTIEDYQRLAEALVMQFRPA
jgi:isopenicillin-N epimerase